MAYNASQQKSPVCYDLRTSPFVYEWGNFKFHFSTEQHVDKFATNAQKRILWLSDSMTRRFHVPCDFENLAVMQLYLQIEGRGFLVEYKGCIYDKPTDIEFYTVAIPTGGE